ncbi:MAG: hypothetical protein IKZ57_07300 [Spirochaetia bacterium]|nr:hypothetical protein [Spirochaetia bacterium]
MKITGICPLIVTKEPEPIIKVFEELGFERRHTKTDIEGGTVFAVVMKDANGNRVAVAKSDNMPKDLTGIAINVDNFQEAYDFFIAKGFVNPRGEGRVTNTSSSKATMLFAPSGYAVSISEHIKK